MLKSHSSKALFNLKDMALRRTRYPLLQLLLYPSTSSSSSNSLKFCSSTSDPHSFRVSYLINNCGFSPETASKASHKLRFDTSQKPDSVLAFFSKHGFSNAQINYITATAPWLLSCNPEEKMLPKLQFLISKGASTSEVVHIVSKGPRFLSRSLNKHIIPAYEFVRGFLQSDKKTIACMIRNPLFLSDSRVTHHVKLLLDNGVTPTNIVRLLRVWPSILCSCDLIKTVDELKELGFESSTSTFIVALLAKRSVSKIRWAEKVDTFKRWGWSEDAIIEAFRKQPYCMLSSADKIDAVMSFWVNEFGHNSLDLVKAPGLFQLSLQKRVIPRASVLEFLISKGLRKKNASLTTPFFIPEKSFLEKFVKRFGEESSHLLALYEEKMDLANEGDKDHNSM